MPKAPFYNFPEVSKSDWWNKIREDLKGQSEDSLYTSLNQNLKVSPFYNSEDLDTASKAFQNLKQSESEKAPNDWDLIQTIHLEGKESKEIRALSDHAREGDVDFLEVIPVESHCDLSNITSNKNLGLIISSANRDVLLKALNSIEAGDFRKIIIDCDYASVLTSHSSLDQFNDLISELSQFANTFPLVVNTDSIVEYGGDEIDEGIYSLALINEMLRSQSKNTNPELLLRLNSGSNFFVEIAKVRALRKLAGVILDSYDSPGSIRIEVHSTIWNKAVYDRYTNILRNTSESFAAVAGGADMLNIRAFETALGIENEFALRNARNISHLLKHESHIDKVKDVSAGSYFIESLTKDFAREVWNGFLKIQESGGLESWMKANNIKADFAQKAEKQRALFGKRRKRMIGTNVYPNPQDQLGKENMEDRKSQRLSAEFERFRVSLDGMALSEGEKFRPSAMLLRLGNSSMRFARAGFSANFLETAGFRMTEQDGMPGDFNNTSIVVICGSDEDYNTQASEWIRQIKRLSEKVLILLAGLPENSEVLKEAGVDFFIHLKAPLEDTLEDIFKALNIETA